MNIFFYSTIGGFGLIAGSFLNALIYRLNTEESVMRGRSHCTKCGRILSWYELVPVFSFIAQKGKCRGCSKRISLQYPLVEIGTALLFFGIFKILNFEFLILNQFLITEFLKLIFLWVIASGLIVIFVYDLRHYLIPDMVLLPLALLTLAAHLFGILDPEFIWNPEFGIWNFGSFFNALVLGFLSALPFALLHFLSGGKAMGFGDVKFAFFMGLLLGYPAVLAAMFIAFTLGAIIGTGLILAGKSSMKSKVPFAPFLVVGTFIGLLWGEGIVEWYTNLLY